MNTRVRVLDTLSDEPCPECGGRVRAVMVWRSPDEREPKQIRDRDFQHEIRAGHAMHYSGYIADFIPCPRCVSS